MQNTLTTTSRFAALTASLVLSLGGCAFDAPTDVEASVQGLNVDGFVLCDIAVERERGFEGVPVVFGSRPEIRIEPFCPGPDEIELDVTVEPGSQIRLGDQIELSMGYAPDSCEIFQGTITRMQPRFSDDARLFVRISGWDLSHRLTRGCTWSPSDELRSSPQSVSGIDETPAVSE